ncbi:hypothetical protein GCM10010435_26640 [Winogradskya consettensis]|uniref:Uncharacterized protein n=1 Tax=Winogradskya consettensis TaxID=113560 RepID=A0A919SAI9_9ACTN|nr:hypothetical protein [Actinoplanes consettensis]GIM68140.1 hypothetical protein Aco04nite_09430 [Actinoplanes consettensis]
MGDTFRFTEPSVRRLVRAAEPLLGEDPARRAKVLAGRLATENGAAVAAAIVERSAV